MTGPSTSGHLDLDALADVLAGERTGEPHLRGCAACTERLAELAGAEVAVVASLATLPAPTLPDGLSERLAGALRAEAARAPAGSDDASTSTSTSEAAPALRSVPASSTAGGHAPVRRRRRTASWLPAVAAGLALVLAGGLGLDALTGAGSEDAAPDTSGGAGGATQESAADAAAADPSGADPSGADLSAQLRALAALPATSGVDYADEAQRRAVLPSLLAAAATTDDVAVPAAPDATQSGAPPASALPGPARAFGDGRPADPSLDRLREPDALAECLAALRREGSPAAEPVALDLATYGGAPALAVLQPDPDPALLVLTVVGPGCSAADADTLLRTQVARP